jgi:NAD(P) transhydrogenase
VIGSGPAGQKAAIAAAKLGKRVGVVERSFTLGGACLHHGTIPSKTLREAASYLSGVRQRGMYGTAYRVKEHITIEDLTFRTQRVIETEMDVVRDQLVRNFVDIIPGTARFMDERTLQVENEGTMRIIPAHKVVIAVGTRPARPDDIEFDDRTIIDSDGLLKLEAIPKSMIFVGAGIIGAEYATIFRTIGVRVTLVDGRKRPLSFLDEEIQDSLYNHMREEGILLRFGERVSSIRSTEDGRVLVETESGKRMTADSLMFAAGRQGASSALGLAEIGLEADDRGRIVVNDHYETAVPGVYAVGDIIGFPSLASTSMEQGRIAALHAMGVDVGAMNPRLPYGIYTIPEIATIGFSEEELTAKGIPFETGVSRFRELARVQINGGSNGLLKLIFHTETLEVLGVHILGTSATELLHIGQAVMELGGTVNYFRDAVFNFPTLAEAYKVAAHDGLNRLSGCQEPPQIREVPKSLDGAA